MSANPPPNGSGSTPAPDMDPAERRVWAASHNLPERYLLVTRDEMQLMMASVTQQRTLVGALQRTHREVEVLLSDYWKNEPDMPNGVAAAVFDATRYKKMVDGVLPELRKIADALAGITNTTPLTNALVMNCVREIRSLVEDIGKRKEQRRNRRAKS